MEAAFWDEIKKSTKFMVICGRKGSGKSHLATNFLGLSILMDLYDEYHIVAAQIDGDNDDTTYAFLKNQKNVYIYENINMNIIKGLKENGKRKCLFIDDATNFLFENRNSPLLLKLVSTTRHGVKCQVIVICHALKSILTPAVRGLIDQLFIGPFTNKKLIEGHLYEENLSMLMEKKEFYNLYVDKIIRGKYNFIYLDIKCNFDFDVNKWYLSKFNRQEVKPNGKASRINTNYDHEERVQKIKESIYYSTIRHDLAPKKSNDVLKIRTKTPRKKINF